MECKSQVLAEESIVCGKPNTLEGICRLASCYDALGPNLRNALLVLCTRGFLSLFVSKNSENTVEEG